MVRGMQSAENETCQAITVDDDVLPELCGKQGYRAHPIDFAWTDVVAAPVLCEFHSSKYTTDLIAAREAAEKEDEEIRKAIAEVFGEEDAD